MTVLDILNMCIAKAEADTLKILSETTSLSLKHICFSRPVSTNLNWFLVKNLRKMASCGMAMDPHSVFTI